MIECILLIFSDKKRTVSKSRKNDFSKRFLSALLFLELSDKFIQTVQGFDILIAGCGILANVIAPLDKLILP